MTNPVSLVELCTLSQMFPTMFNPRKTDNFSKGKTIIFLACPWQCGNHQMICERARKQSLNMTKQSMNKTLIQHLIRQQIDFLFHLHSHDPVPLYDVIKLCLLFSLCLEMNCASPGKRTGTGGNSCSGPRQKVASFRSLQSAQEVT